MKRMDAKGLATWDSTREVIARNTETKQTKIKLGIATTGQVRPDLALTGRTPKVLTQPSPKFWERETNDEKRYTFGLWVSDALFHIFKDLQHLFVADL